MDWGQAMNKYLVRKLLFVIALGLAIYAPIGVTAYQSRTTDDPHILMARYLEQLPIGGIDVLNLIDDDKRGVQLLVMVYIEDFPNWTIRQEQENFKRDVVAMTSDNGYDSVLVFVGWDYPPPGYRIQGIWNCQALRASECEWEPQPSVLVDSKHVKWAGIGKP